MEEEDVGASQINVMLIGKTGAGKSAAGNTILDRNIFPSDDGFSPITKACELQQAIIEKKQVAIVDSPDFVFNTLTGDNFAEMERGIALCPPGVHVFLLVISLCTFTKEDSDLVLHYMQRFGELMKYTIVVFTNGDKLQGKTETVDNWIMKSAPVFRLIGRCGRRYHVLNNRKPKDRGQVRELMQKICKLVSDNENTFYTTEMLTVARNRRRRPSNYTLLVQFILKYKPLCVICGVIIAVAAGAYFSRWRYTKNQANMY